MTDAPVPGVPPFDPRTITPELVRALLAGQFPQWSGLPVRPVAAQGWDNRTFRIGDGLLARLPSHAMYVPQVDKELQWLPVLAPALPVAIPAPVARGEPGEGYPFPWSVRRWIEGDVLAAATVDAAGVALDVAGFLRALQALPADGGPAAGPHSFGRGGELRQYDLQTREAIAALADRIDAVAAGRLWTQALAAGSAGQPVWVHGDVSPANLLVRAGRLAAVIDFGQLAVGDPACDLVIAWTAFDPPARERFRAAVGGDAGSWARARGWLLWKALITAAQSQPRGDAALARAGLRFGWRIDALGIVGELLAEVDR